MTRLWGSQAYERESWRSGAKSATRVRWSAGRFLTPTTWDRGGSSRTCRRCARCQRRDQADSRLHALPARRQGHQGGLTMRQVDLRRPTRRRPWAPTRRPSTPAICSSSRGRSRSIPATGDLVEGDITAQTEQVMRNLDGAAARRRRRLRARRPHDGLSGGHERLRGDERGLRQLHRRSAAGARDGAGRPAAARREDRNRRDRGDP